MKKFLKSMLVFAVLLPCLCFLTACGGQFSEASIDKGGVVYSEEGAAEAFQTQQAASSGKTDFSSQSGYKMTLSAKGSGSYEGVAVNMDFHSTAIVKFTEGVPTEAAAKLNGSTTMGAVSASANLETYAKYDAQNNLWIYGSGNVGGKYAGINVNESYKNKKLVEVGDDAASALDFNPMGFDADMFLDFSESELAGFKVEKGTTKDGIVKFHLTAKEGNAEFLNCSAYLMFDEEGNLVGFSAEFSYEEGGRSDVKLVIAPFDGEITYPAGMENWEEDPDMDWGNALSL